jgi:hypothetical protein
VLTNVSMAQQIEDRKCQLFAENLPSRLERKHTAFFVDSSSEEGYGLSIGMKAR